jgi:predicted SAM-dependent methyltransferase
MQASIGEIEWIQAGGCNPGKRLNLCCGDNKIAGYINIDANSDLNPDVVADIISAPLPYEDESIDEILLFHAIEHIEHKRHEYLLSEFWRLLKSKGSLYITYPEFSKVATNYLQNYRGMKDFWRDTIYGLQRYPGDYHVSLMDTVSFVEKVKLAGFVNIETCPEPNEEYNTIVYCEKGPQVQDYENLIVESVGLK